MTASAQPASPASSVAPSLAAAARAELQRHAPFNRMEAADVDWMVARLSIVYFAPDASILAPDSGVPAHCFIVRSGAVAGLDPQAHSMRWQLVPGEAFPIGALLGERGVTSLYRATGDTFCWRLDVADFKALLDRSSVFRDFCTQRLSTLLVASRQRMQREYAEDAARDPLTQPLAALIRRAPVCCAHSDSLSLALGRMREAGVGAIVVCDADGAATGIFTLRDLRDRVALESLRHDVPISAVMSPAPVALPADALALDAALVMARHGFHHVVVTEAGRVTGVVSESDLFALRRLGMTGIGESMRRARDLDELARCAADTRQLAALLLAQGVAAGQLTRVISTLNDALTARILELETQRAGIAADSFCWLALGSEGRAEQTLASDQDNAIVFAADDADEMQTMRDRLVAFARNVNAALARCGFPLCRGDIMAGNPQWCASLSEWQAMFAQWIDRPESEALLHASIFFDFRPIFGAEALAQRLRAWLTAQAKERTIFLRLMAENALRNEPPLGVVRDFALQKHDGAKDSIDLKTSCLTPFVDAARILALAGGEPASSTVERLQGMIGRRALAAAEVDAWIQAFQFVQMLRLRHQQEQARRGEPLDNFLQPDRLNELDRRILKEALRQARKLQQRLRLDYRL